VRLLSPRKPWLTILRPGIGPLLKVVMLPKMSLPISLGLFPLASSSTRQSSQVECDSTFALRPLNVRFAFALSAIRDVEIVSAVQPFIHMKRLVKIAHEVDDPSNCHSL